MHVEEDITYIYNVVYVFVYLSDALFFICMLTIRQAAAQHFKLPQGSSRNNQHYNVL